MIQDVDNEQPATAKRRCVAATHADQCSAVTEKNMKYNLSWQTKWKLEKNEDGMFCLVCMKYSKPPPQACGAWVTRPVKNWAKATELLAKHEKGEWHSASVEAQALSELAEQHGDIMDQMLAASDLERQQNRERMKN